MKPSLGQNFEPGQGLPYAQAPVPAPANPQIPASFRFRPAAQALCLEGETLAAPVTAKALLPKMVTVTSAMKSGLLAAGLALAGTSLFGAPPVAKAPATVFLEDTLAKLKVGEKLSMPSETAFVTDKRSAYGSSVLSLFDDPSVPGALIMRVGGRMAFQVIQQADGVAEYTRIPADDDPFRTSLYALGVAGGGLPLPPNNPESMVLVMIPDPVVKKPNEKK